MKTYDELTNDILEKTKAEKKRRGAMRRRVISASLALVLVLGAVFIPRFVFGSGEDTSPSREITENDGKTQTPPSPSSSYLSTKGDYSGIFAMISETSYANQAPTGLFDFFSKKEADADYALPEKPAESYNSGAEPSAMTEDEATTTVHSETNVQVAGVDEADVVKTDGKYVYAVSHRNVYIYEANGGELTLVSKAAISGDDGALLFSGDDGEALVRSWGVPEIYITGDRLVVTLNAERRSERKEVSDNVFFKFFVPGYASSAVESSHYYFAAMVFDISEKSAPELMTATAISGSALSSRMIGDRLYLVSSDEYYSVVEDDPATFIPSVYANGETDLVSGDSVFCGEEKSDCCYLNVLELDVESAAEKSSLSLLGYRGDVMYQSENAIYVAKTVFEYSNGHSIVTEPGKLTETTVSQRSTELTKIGVDGGLALAATAKLDGNVLNSFSMDEYDGYLRVVTSVVRDTSTNVYIASDGYLPADTDEVDWGRYGDVSGSGDEEMFNDLFVLDGSLAVVGSLTNIAPDERIYSCRFEGDQGYFVTYRETDPLFHADLSDPTAPVIVGELKLPGYSGYLQRFGDYMLGFGVSENGRLKVSMFSEKEDGSMEQIDFLELTDAAYSEALYDHHAILADASRGVICFGATVYYDDWKSYTDSVVYYVLSYGEEGFRIERVFGLGNAWPDELRGFYIGDFFYVYQEGAEKSAITSLDFTDFEVVGEVTMDAPEDYVYGGYGVIYD